MSKKVTLIFIICFSFPYFCHPVFGQNNQSTVGVSPAIIESILLPNSSKRSTVYVYNLSENPLPIKSTVQKMIPQEEINDNQENIFSSESWINIEPKEFILKPQERKEIKINIKIPKNAEPGGHYATILFEPLIPQTSSTKSVGIATKVGILAFLVVKGDIVENCEIISFNTKKFWLSIPINLEITLKNTGNIHLLPRGKIVIRNLRKKIITVLPLNNNMVLPQTSKPINIEWTKNNIFGRYTAELELNYGSENQSLKSNSIVFWFMPINYTLLFILLTLIVIYLTINKKKLKLVIKILFNP